MGSISILLARQAPPDASRVSAMLAAAPHRGAEHAVAEVGRCVLGVSRDPAGAGAAIATLGGTAAAVAGTIDNLADLACELGLEQAASASSADVVLHAFRRWSAAAPSRLRGAYAAAVTNGESVWCFRDHIGFGTLFQRLDATGYFAASEAKQILAGASMRPEPDLDGLRRVFAGVVDPDSSAYAGIGRIEPAVVSEVRCGSRIAARRYWDPTGLLESRRIGLDEAAEGLAHHLDHAVRRMVTGRDAVALSGGMDSPSVAAFAAPEHLRVSGRTLTAISSVYPNQPSVDERPMIELVAEALGLDLHLFELRSRPLDDLAYWVRALDGPWEMLAIPQMAEVWDVAKQAGAQTVLLGDLAEYALGMQPHLLGHLLLHGRLRAVWAQTADRLGRGASPRGVARDVVSTIAPARLAVAYARARRLDYRRRPPWLTVDATGARFYRPDLERPARRRWKWLQVAQFGGISTGLEASQLCAERAGIRARSPFADIDLWEFLLSLPGEVKFPDAGPKTLLRTAMHDRLPQAHLSNRKKVVFDEHVWASVDWQALEAWVLRTEHRLPGVDYGLLGDRLLGRTVTLDELVWIGDLARVHAFLAMW